MRNGFCGSGQQTPVDRFMRTLQGVAEGKRVGGTVAFYNNTTQPQQCRAIIATIVDLIAQAIQDRTGNYPGAHGENIASEFGPHHGGDHAGDTFNGLEHHIADEAVANDDVHRTLADVVAFDIAVKVQPAFAEKFRGLLDDFIALDDFFTNVQQAYRGLLAPIERPNQGSAHDGKLQQVFGGAINIGAKIEHRGGAALDIGNGGGDGWTVNAV